MTQVADVIKDALGFLRVIGQEDEAPEAHQTAQAIYVLNNMMNRLEADGVALGWQGVSEPEADIPIPPEAVEGIAAMLAVRLRPKYGTALDPDVIALARSSEGKLKADGFANRVFLTESPDLPLGEGQGGLYGWQAGLNG
jgi:hypothetical protein